MQNPFQIVKDFEDAVADYVKSPYCVAVNSCTSALFTCLSWMHGSIYEIYGGQTKIDNFVTLPKKTYIGVAQSCLNAGFKIHFNDCNWKGCYRITPYPLHDSARRFTSGMYIKGQYMCTSHHWSKTLPIGHGGCILHDNSEFDIWARKFRFDGRTEGVAPKDDQPIRGHHLYLLPELAASGLVRLSHLPKHNPDLPLSDYPDLSKMDIFK